MKHIDFTVPGPLRGKGRPRFTKAGHTFTPQTTREYEDLIRACYLEKMAGGKLDDGPVLVAIAAYYKRGRGDKGANVPTKKPDIDNIVKIVLDALNGVAYADDKAVVRVDARKQFSPDEPYLVVWLEVK